RVVFTFQSDGSSPHSNPAIDNVTLSANIPPIISGFNPASGCTGSGTITITGSYLTGASAVTIGGTPVSSITSNTDSEIQAVIGSGTTGLVAVTTTYGTGNSASNYTVNPLPTLFSVTGGGSYCSGGSGVAIGLSGSQVGVNYTLNPAGVVVAGTGSAISFGNQTSAGSYTVTATNVSTGCTSNMTGSASVGIINVPVISAQPTDQSVCAGASVSFSTTASGGTLSYQWRKGTTNLSNGGSISGATSATLTINPAVLGDAATDYNCVITNTCGSVETDFATLGVSSNAIAPSAQASALTFPTVGVTSIIGSFTPSASATHYLVVRTPTVLPPANPVNGTTYPVGSAALGLGTFVEYSGIATEFTSNGLDQGTT
ncbi:MAG TPA: immunoglobulin domain-containing protein, partial [Ferruginibacter sp.]|nr:immunoglobulin domain-containing protein [Ferruginibacter sp.]